MKVRLIRSSTKEGGLGRSWLRTEKLELDLAVGQTAAVTIHKTFPGEATRASVVAPNRGNYHPLVFETRKDGPPVVKLSTLLGLGLHVFFSADGGDSVQNMVVVRRLGCP